MHEHRDIEHDSGPAVSVSHFFRTLHEYTPIILLSIIAVMIAYAIVATTVYLLAPSTKITTLRFRLDFEGADEGKYPNGAKFAVGDVVTTPVLLKVYRENNLEQFMSFPAFARSMFVLEANDAYDRLVREYQARWNDPKLQPMDRERLQREFDQKVQAISKNEYSINFVASSNDGAMRRTLPKTIVRKVLSDTLTAWADYASVERRVLNYRVAVLSPAFVPMSNAPPREYITAMLVLRWKIYRVLDNLREITELPGSEMARTSGDSISLREVSIRLDDVIRFRLDPLMAAVQDSGLIGDRTAAIRFVENQLAYDQRMLAAAEATANAVRESMNAYSNRQQKMDTTSADSAATPSRPEASEMVMPQVSESFLARLVQLANEATDVEYRQRLADDLRAAEMRVAPAEIAVAYDQQILAQLNSSRGSTARIDAAAAAAELASIQSEVRNLVVKMNELYQNISRNLRPATAMFTVSAVPTTRSERAVALPRLMLYGVVVFLVSIPLIIAACLIHNRVREEERMEEREAAAVV